MQLFTSAAYANGQWFVCGGDAVLRSTARLQSKSTFKLQLVHENFNTWMLSVAGNAGETFMIEAASELGGEWIAYQAVTIPAAGQVFLPLDSGAGNRFFRAKTSAE